MQAARGASLNDADDQGEEYAAAEPSRSPRQARVIIGIVAVLLLAIDQLTKAWAVANLTPGQPEQVVGDLLRFNLIRNPGAAFGTLTDHTELFTALAIVATLVILWFAARTSSRAWGVALGFLLAGVVGNLIDRLTRAPGDFGGHVVDFLELPNWPIFNVADMAINVAAVLILVLAWKGVRLGGGSSAEGSEES